MTQASATIPFPDQEDLERRRIRRLVQKNLDALDLYEDAAELHKDLTAEVRHADALIAADCDGFARGVHVGWWWGAKQGAVFGGLVGLLIGGCIVMLFAQLGLKP